MFTNKEKKEKKENMKNFKEFIKSVMEETTSVDIEKVDNKLWEIRKRKDMRDDGEKDHCNELEKLKDQMKIFVLLK
jgi:hypothetical protein